jgi:hypothetical protein
MHSECTHVKTGQDIPNAHRIGVLHLISTANAFSRIQGTSFSSTSSQTPPPTPALCGPVPSLVAVQFWTTRCLALCAQTCNTKALISGSCTLRCCESAMPPLAYGVINPHHLSRVQEFDHPNRGDVPRQVMSSLAALLTSGEPSIALPSSPAVSPRYPKSKVTPQPRRFAHLGRTLYSSPLVTRCLSSIP